MNIDDDSIRPNALALLPMGIFLALFIGSGVVLTLAGEEMAFYQLSPVIAILPAIALALALGGRGLSKRIETFLAGAGEINIITMCIIYLLAGGFAQVSKAIGGVDAMVNLGLAAFPAGFFVPGIFVISCVVSTAMGTSMGTIAAIGPIAVGLAGQTDLSLPILMAAVVGGAMFGDNLSVISDTTIAATRTQGAEMRDKFRVNVWIATPAALLALAAFIVSGQGGTEFPAGEWSALQVLPYAAILILALLGVNVFVVLFLGIVLAGVFGMFTVEGYTPIRFARDVYEGFAGMNEILVLSLLMGGLGELIRSQGGLDWLVDRISRLVLHRSADNLRPRGELSIAGLVAAADLSTANNTVAIILTGKMAHAIAVRSGVTPPRSASMMDIGSCVVQGLIPYGAQLLLAGSIASLSPFEILRFNYYPYLLAAATVVAIVTGRPKR